MKVGILTTSARQHGIVGESLGMGDNSLRVFAVFASLVALPVATGWGLAGTTGALAGLAFAMLMQSGAYFFAHRLTLKATGARQAAPNEAPELRHLVARLAERAGVPTPDLYIIDSDTPNAFATGRDGHRAAIAVTAGSLRLLSREELAGVLAHELAHVKNRDTLAASLVATAAGMITGLAFMVLQATSPGGTGTPEEDPGPVGLASYAFGVLLYTLAPFAALLVRATMAGDREYLADEAGARVLGDSLPLASALEKMEVANQVAPLRVNPATAHQFTVSPLGCGRLAALFRTHPTAETRVERLRRLALGQAPPQDWML